jgi:hypothetical protein
MLRGVDTPPLRPAQERALRAMDQLVVEEAARLREGLDAERQNLRDALSSAAREVLRAGDAAAARIVALGDPIARGFQVREEPARAQRVLLASRLAHDRVRAAATRLADEVRAMEGDLAAPLRRTARGVQREGLPALRRVVEEAARSGVASDAALEAHLAEARASARAQVDGALSRMAQATAQGGELIRAMVDGLPSRLVAAVEGTVPGALESVGREAALPTRRWWTTALLSVATGIALLLVISTTLLSYGVGLGLAGALFGAIVLTGTYAPPVGAGFVAAATGTLLAAAITDLLFNVLGDWREGRDDGLLGAHVPVRAVGRLPRPADLQPVLAVLRLAPPPAPHRTATPAPYAPFAGPPPGDLRTEPTTDPGLVDADAHRHTREALHAEVVRDVTTDEEPEAP